MKSELKALLDALDFVGEEHGEIGDTDVREQMYEAVYHGFIVQTPGYTLPQKYRMFEPEGDVAVRATLSDFIPAACVAAEREGLHTPQQRFEAFQDGSVMSQAGSYYDDFFGHADSLAQLNITMNPTKQQ